MSKNLSRRDISILIANSLDHFDSALYGFLAPIMSISFFPEHDEVVRYILAYSMFATSIVTRPAGALIFGLLADRKGPIIPMIYSLIGISLCSLLLAFIPSYEHIGYYSALLLLVLRFVKGTFSSGESTIAKIYILDGKKNDQAFKSSHLYQFSSMMGIFFASILSTIAYSSTNESFWRLCYILTAIMGLVTFLIRWDKKIYSTYNSRKLDIKILNKELLWKYRYPILAIIFTTGLSHITYLIPFVIMNSLMPLISGIEISDMMKLNNILLIFDTILIILSIPIAKRFGIINIKLIIPIILGVTIPILFSSLNNASLSYTTFIRVWIVMLGVIFMIPQNIMYNNIFGDFKGKYLIIGIANALGAGFIGKISPAIIFYTYYKYNNMLIVGIYISFISFLTAYYVFKCREFINDH